MYHGALNNKQYTAFINAVGNASGMMGDGSIHLEKLSLFELRMNKWSLQEFVSWLLDSDMHFIICHIHQGVCMCL
jgi:hypothetical protein